MAAPGGSLPTECDTGGTTATGLLTNINTIVNATGPATPVHCYGASIVVQNANTVALMTTPTCVIGGATAAT